MAAILFRKLHDDNHRTPLDTRVTQAKRVSCDPPAFQRRHDGFNSKQNLGFTHQPAPTHLQHPYEKRPKVSKKMLAERCSTQSSTGREWMPERAGNGDPCLAALSRLSLLLSVHHLASR